MIDLTSKSSSYQAIRRLKGKMVFESKVEVLTKEIPKKKKKKIPETKRKFYCYMDGFTIDIHA